MSTIPGQTTLAAVRTLVRSLTDVTSSQVVTDSEINSYINLDYQELYGLLVTSFEDNYFLAAPYQFQTDGSTLIYPVPSDFFKLRGVDLSLSGTPGSYITLKPFNFRERNRLNNAYAPSQSFNVLQDVRYQLNGSGIMLTPLAQAGQTIQLWYVPRVQPLINDTDILDGVNGWEQYVIAAVSAKVMIKQQLDPSEYVARQQAMASRIIEEAANRNAGDATTVSDVYATGWEE